MSKRRWTTYEIDFLMANYKKLGNKEIGDAIGRSAGAVKKYMQERDIKRSASDLYLIRRRMAKRHNSGHFVKGHVPHNANYDGHERITKDGYVEIRLSAGNYQLKHKYLWEKEHGKVPEGWCLECRDGNRLNTSPTNWKLITRIENILKNSRYYIPDEILPSLVLINRIKQKLNTIENG